MKQEVQIEEAKGVQFFPCFLCGGGNGNLEQAARLAKDADQTRRLIG